MEHMENEFQEYVTFHVTAKSRLQMAVRQGNLQYPQAPPFQWAYQKDLSDLNF